MRRIVLSVFALAVASAVAIVPARAQVSASHSPPSGALVAPGDAPELTLLYTGDVIGYLDPCG